MWICGTANLIKYFYLDWRSYANWGHIKSVAENTFPLHSSGKTMNDKPRKCEILGDTEAFQYSGYLHFQMYLERWDHLTYSFQAVPQNHIFMEVFKKLRFHVAFVEILMALSQIGNTIGNMGISWKTRSIPGDAWNDSFSFRTFRSYPNVCLCRKELLCGRSQLWHPFAHILCVTPRLHWQMVTSISFMKHNQQTNPKPNHQKTFQLVYVWFGCWIFSL